MNSADLLVREVQRMTSIYLASETGRRMPLYDVVVGAVEKPLIECVIRYHSGNVSRAALTLGINRNTLRKKLATHGIRPER